MADPLRLYLKKQVEPNRLKLAVDIQHIVTETTVAAGPRGAEGSQGLQSGRADRLGVERVHGNFKSIFVGSNPS